MKNMFLGLFALVLLTVMIAPASANASNHEILHNQFRAHAEFIEQTQDLLDGILETADELNEMELKVLQSLTTQEILILLQHHLNQSKSEGDQIQQSPLTAKQLLLLQYKMNNTEESTTGDRLRSNPANSSDRSLRSNVNNFPTR